MNLEEIVGELLEALSYGVTMGLPQTDDLSDQHVKCSLEKYVSEFIHADT